MSLYPKYGPASLLTPPKKPPEKTKEKAAKPATGGSARSKHTSEANSIKAASSSKSDYFTPDNIVPRRCVVCGVGISTQNKMLKHLRNHITKKEDVEKAKAVIIGYLDFEAQKPVEYFEPMKVIPKRCPGCDVHISTEKTMISHLAKKHPDHPEVILISERYEEKQKEAKRAAESKSFEDYMSIRRIEPVLLKRFNTEMQNSKQKLFKARVNLELFPIFEELFRHCTDASPCVDVDMMTREEAKKAKMFGNGYTVRAHTVARLPYCSKSLRALLKRSTKIRNRLVHGDLEDTGFLFIQFRDEAYKLLSRHLESLLQYAEVHGTELAKLINMERMDFEEG